MKPPSWMRIDTGPRIDDPTSPSGYSLSMTVRVRPWHPGFWLFVLREWWRNGR